MKSSNYQQPGGQANYQQSGVPPYYQQPGVPPYYQQPGVPPYYQQPVVQQRSRSNGLGTAGFVLAIIGLTMCWIPVAGIILSVLGFIFSFIGVFRRPKGLAIAGLIISIITIVLIAALFSVLAHALNH